METELLSFTPSPEKHIERCARICYNSVDKITDDSYKAFLRGLMLRGHFSVIEHAYATIVISGITRAATHQLVRHRHFSYSQQSQRYCRLVNTINILDLYDMPQSIRDNTLAPGVYLHAIEEANDMYHELLKIDGIKPEDARAVLPNATYSTIVVTGNFRSWLEFFQKRLDTHAQEEIRKVALSCLKMMNQIAPIIFNLETLTNPITYSYNLEEIKLAA